jgi:hypothetical protein
MNNKKILFTLAILFLPAAALAQETTNDIWANWWGIYGQQFFFLIYTGVILFFFFYAFIQWWL